MLTFAFTGLLAALVIFWGPDRVRDMEAEPVPATLAGLFVGLLAACFLTYALAQWVRSMLSTPVLADMLIVVREGTRRFLDGMNPYTHYRTYDAPWDMVLPYGPLLWGPYLVPQALQVDLRVVSIAGALSVPVWAAVTATVEARRRRAASAAAWLVLLVAIVSSVQFSGFTLMGHTPAYWPLLPLFAWCLTERHWRSAAVVLGALLVARSTMVALVPVFLVVVWTRDRSRALMAVSLVVGTALVFILPFVLWDAGALWDNMVASYPRIVKSVVWPSPVHGIANTIGLTGWLVSHRLERWVEASQVVGMIAVYAAAWRPLRRGARPLPWMGLSLLVFSLTSLWPVYYLYFDVLLLLVSGAAIETLAGRFSVKTWALGTSATALAVVLATLMMTSTYPSLAFAPPTPPGSFALSRRTTAAAFVMVDYTATGEYAAPVVVTATLNGHELWTSPVAADAGTLRVPAPASTWWIGFNRLDIAVAPQYVAAFSVSRIRVVAGPR